jgi:hypothetical protein
MSARGKARNHTRKPLTRQWNRSYLRRQRVPSAESSISMPAPVS